MFAPIRPGQAVADIVGFRRAEHAEKREGLPPFTLGPDGLARGVMTVGQAAEGAGLLVLVAYSTSARLTRLWEVTAQLLVLSPRTPACLSRSLAWSKRPMRRSSWPRLFSVRASSEEREAERARAEAARAEQSQAAEEKRRHDAFLTTPLGAATAAKEAGQPFLEIQLEVGGHVGSAQFGITDGRRTSSSSAATLGEIERSAGAWSMRATTS
jgi:hypothetical protein